MNHVIKQIQSDLQCNHKLYEIFLPSSFFSSNSQFAIYILQRKFKCGYSFQNTCFFCSQKRVNYDGAKFCFLLRLQFFSITSRGLALYIFQCDTCCQISTVSYILIQIYSLIYKFSLNRMNNKLIEQGQNQQKDGFPVYVNVYHFWSDFNSLFNCCGIGVYHTGIQIDSGVEYMYYGFDGDESGVIGIHPYTAAYIFQQQILLGYVSNSYYELHTKIIESLEKEYIGNRYDLLQRNCNHFSRSMAQKLGIQQKIPRKIFRVTDCCNYLRCCIPNCILNGRLDWFNWGQQQQQNQYMDQLDNYQVMVNHSTQSHRIKQTTNDEKRNQFEKERLSQEPASKKSNNYRKEDELQIKVLKKSNNDQTKSANGLQHEPFQRN